MEIYSLRSIGNFLHKNEGKSQREHTANSQTTPILRKDSFIEQFEEVASAYEAITPRQLRERALQGYEGGTIDLETYHQLAAELPMQAIDQQGRLLDLSTITDDTLFNFREYYRNQMEIALNVGDQKTADVLRAAVFFLEG